MGAPSKQNGPHRRTPLRAAICLKQIILAEGRDLPLSVSIYMGFLQLDHGPHVF